MTHKHFCYLSRSDWGWLGCKAFLGLAVPLTLYLFEPNAVKTGAVSAAVLYALLILMLIGSVISIAGIIVRATAYRPLIVGYAVEIGGLIALIAAYALLGLVFGIPAILAGGAPTGIVICLAIAAPLVARAVDIMHFHLAPKQKDTPNEPPTPKDGD